MSEPLVHLAADLNPPGSGAWQGASQNARTGEWFVAHSRGSHLGGSAEDVHLYRFDARGRYRDQMVLVDAGHVYGFGVQDQGPEDRPLVWITWDGSDGNDVVTIPYRPGVFRKSAARKLHVFTEASVQASLSPTRKGVVLCRETDGRYLFTKRLVADVLADQDKPQGVTITVAKTRDWLQGFALSGMSLYVGTGRTSGRSLIRRFDLETGRLTGTMDVTRYGLLRGERTAGAALELEGLDAVPGAILFSRKVHKGDARRLRVYRLTNF